MNSRFMAATRKGLFTVERTSTGRSTGHWEVTAADFLGDNLSIVHDGTGERLAFGSTTGGLWVSENAGNDWQCVAQHLPPVHCVRFLRH